MSKCKSVFEATPIAAPESVPELLLFGGSFDPVTLGHVSMAFAARDRTGGPGCWLVFVPAARSPHKDTAPEATDADRVELLNLAVEGRDRACVWTDEIDRAGKGVGRASYWVDTLERARCGRAHAKLRFLIGSDQAVAFGRWRDYRRILELADPVVVPRSPILDAESLRAEMGRSGCWSDAELAVWGRRMLRVDALDVSATRVRSLLRSNAVDEAFGGVLNQRVLRAIRGRGLYSSER